MKQMIFHTNRFSTAQWRHSSRWADGLNPAMRQALCGYRYRGRADCLDLHMTTWSLMLDTLLINQPDKALTRVCSKCYHLAKKERDSFRQKYFAKKGESLYVTP